MTATDTNGQHETSAYWGQDNDWPAAETPVGTLPRPPAPPPPPPAPTAVQARPEPAIPVQQQPVMPAAQPRVMSAPPGYQVGAWPTHPPVEDEGDEDPAPPARTPAKPKRSTELETTPAGEPPKVSVFAPLGAWWKNSRKRSRTLTVTGVCILSLLGGRFLVTSAAGQFGAAAARGAEAGASRAVTANSVPGGQTKTVVIPTDFFACPLTSLGETAVGHVADGTLDPIRSDNVATQVRKLMGLGARITDMYISTPLPTQIIVTPGPDPAGTQLFNCKTGAVPAAADGNGSTATSAPGGATTATSAPR